MNSDRPNDQEAAHPDLAADLSLDGIEGLLLTRPKPNFDAVHEPTHPNVRKAVYDETTNTVTLYLPDGWEVVELYEDNIVAGIDRGVKVFSINEIAAIEVDSHGQRTCKWFTGDADDFVDSDVETSDAFRFYKPLGSCSCSHPDVVKRDPSVNHSCDYAAAMVNCNIYEAQDWQVVRIVKGTLNSGKEEEVSLSKTRRGYGEPIYKATTEDGERSVTLEEFEADISSYDMKEEIPLTASKPKNSFLEFVLGEKNDVVSAT